MGVGEPDLGDSAVLGVDGESFGLGPIFRVEPVGIEGGIGRKWLVGCGSSFQPYFGSITGKVKKDPGWIRFTATTGTFSS